MKLIAMSGYARSGKDTAQSLLASDGWGRVAFADVMRTFITTLNPILDGTGRVGSYVRLSDVIESVGWEGYKSSIYNSEIRTLLQRLGTDCGRALLGNDVWVDAALNNIPDGRYIITDCRFINEAEAVRERGGKIYRINRPGIGPANSHPSETALDNYEFDEIINNDGTLEEFKKKLQEIV